MPAPQGVQLLAPPVAYLPTAQLLQAPVAPELAVYLPGAQTVHAERPVTADVVPAGHAVHSALPVAGANLPLEHERHVVAPDAAEFLPAPQLLQLAVPVKAW